MTSMKTTLASALLLVAGPLASTQVHAQAGQTAEGAQKFFAQLVEGGRASIDGRLEEVPMRVTGTYHRKTGKQDWYGFDKHAEEPIAYEGVGALDVKATSFLPSGACASVIGGISYGQIYEQRETAKVAQSGAGYLGDNVHTIVGGKAPYQLRIEWGQVKVARLTQGDGIVVSWMDPNYRNTWVALRTSQGAEMAERMEYAGKFLQASCDSTADTGF